ncbi:hypothetical protein [Sphingosinicella soli]|uniref:Uncharacterized protein n=1 Tax=Sphingosinicella soli TaxID=333708 RepID=A0A7W7F5E6_9SPHN|nr:hypothetical protein [Sphingosinicella soli]MBB4630619.1 hypothetical protein [Sphingosinicella soli]
MRFGRSAALAALLPLWAGAVSAQPLEGVYVLPEAFKTGLTLSRIKVPAGTILRRVESEAKLKVCSETMTVFQLGLPYGRACFFDDDGDGTFDRVAGSSLAGPKTLKMPLPYHAVEISPVTALPAKSP